MKQRSPLVLLGVALFIWGAGEGMFMIFNPLYLESFGADPLKIGAILGAFGMSMTLAHIPAGYLSDRFGARLLMRWAWMTGMLATLTMAQARGLSVFILGLLLYGVTAAVSAPLSAYVTAARGKLSLARALTTVTATFNAGYIIGSKLGGWLADKIALHVLYQGALVLFALSTILVWMLPNRREPASVDETASAPQALWRNSPYMLFLGLIFVLMLGMYLPQPLTPNYLRDIHNLTYNQIGTLGAIGSLGNVILSLALGRLADWRRAYLAAQAAVMLFALIIWRGASLSVFALGYFMLGGYRAARALTTAKIRTLVHAEQIGVAYAVSETVSGSTTVLAPMLAGALYARRPGSIYLGALALLLAAMAGTVYFLKRETAYAENHHFDVGTL